MLIDFFLSLRHAKLKVSVREYLTLLEALQANVVGPASEACSIDDFYHLARTVMVKDENVCLHCGMCAERCPTGAWDMQKFLLQWPRAGAEGVKA